MKKEIALLQGKDALVYAHSANRSGESHSLLLHLQNVACLASGFTEKYGARELGYWLGMWHDLGKFNPAFQAYLDNPTGNRGPDHSSAGAILAVQIWEGFAFPLAGHHGGLSDWCKLKQRLQDKNRDRVIQDTLSLTRKMIPDLLPDQSLTHKLPAYLTTHTRLDFFLRMLFSALVDADFLDTEAHFEPQRILLRSTTTDLNTLWKRFEANQKVISGQRIDPLNQIRHEIYLACLRAGELPPGIFRLTVPTGGGKTLSGMAFALSHALKYKLERVIMAIPYTSIIEQTADVYRNIFGNEAVLEHHSAVSSEEDPDGPSPAEMRSRLAAENWDAPIVVTTTVQLFESIFANKTSRCRKLHNIARSVLILDEVQTLPMPLLEPILDVLRDLADHYSVTIVLCTATQPALMEGPYLKGLKNIREIVPEPARYFAVLKRVRYELPQKDESWSWSRVAEEMRQNNQCLAVVNTKKDALALLDALGDPDALHLSTLLCGAHRRKVIAEVRRRLATEEPCRLISTQVVEAGVDLDFPVVLRAMGPLDRIVQAAGRCNREGRLKNKQGNPVPGRVIVFTSMEGHTPRGVYLSGTHEAANFLNREDVDLHDPGLYEQYFQQLNQTVETDVQGIQKLRSSLDFPEVAARFQMIKDNTIPVVIRLPSDLTDGLLDVNSLIGQIRTEYNLSRDLLRRLQPFIVDIYAREAPRLLKEGLIAEVSPGFYEWLGGYDHVCGLTESARNPEELVW